MECPTHSTTPVRPGDPVAHPSPWWRWPALLLALLVCWPGLGPVPARADGAAFTVRPVPGEVAHPFDAPAQPWLPGHRGVDLQAPEGTPVRAPGDGVVSFVGVVVDRPVLSIRHADAGGRSVVSSYEPVSASVHVGQRVSAGQVVGFISLGGHCSQACLHWGLRLDGAYVDPMGWLAASVRLLPADAVATVLPPAPPPPAPPQLLAPAGASTGGGVRPAAGPITSGFGMRFHPVLHVWKLHDGTDIGAPCGAPVGAIWAGTVVDVEHNIAWGNRVVVDHGLVNGQHVRTSYNHMSAVLTTPGAHLSAGQQLGRVGSTGYSTGCHLHVQLWRNATIVDPLSVVGWR